MYWHEPALRLRGRGTPAWTRRLGAPQLTHGDRGPWLVVATSQELTARASLQAGGRQSLSFGLDSRLSFGLSHFRDGPFRPPGAWPVRRARTAPHGAGRPV
eukprot:scaffold52663_cov65-Phaeocystis_antarctica.AAC.7